MTKGKWGKEVDRNLFTTLDTDRTKFAKHDCDANSLVGDPHFVDSVHGDFRVKEGSPALKLGFVNFPIDQFGVVSPALKAKARSPELPALLMGTTQTLTKKTLWQGALVKELEGEEFSAFGTAKEDGGVSLLEVPAGSSLAKAGLKAGDVIKGIDGKKVRGLADLFDLVKSADGKSGVIKYVRNQEALEAVINFSSPAENHFGT
jgi:predicted metalloprotease with PDZ domain